MLAWIRLHRRVLVRITGWLSVVAFVGSLGVVAHLRSLGFFELPDFSAIDRLPESSIVYDAARNRIKEFCVECRETIPLSEMGVFPRVAVAVEDKNFWTRWLVVSSDGIGRALIEDIKTRELSQGASTITQQASRNLFLRRELERERETDSKSAKWWRKFREIWVSIHLERRLTRAQVLELYLNIAYCGNGRYGVEACSQWYYGRPASKLSVPEAALIAGLWRSPGSNPGRDKDKAKALRNRVLGQLEKQGVLSARDRELAEQIPMPIRYAPMRGTEHFAEAVRRDFSARGKFVDYGIRVQTALEPRWQHAANEALRASIEGMQKRNPEISDFCGAAFAIDVKTGDVKVWAAYPDFVDNEYDLIRQAERHAGSTFKPFFLAAWLEAGGRASPEDEGSGPAMLDDSYGTANGKSGLWVSMGGGRGRHYLQNFPFEGQLRYRGMIPAILAIAESRNVAIMSGVAGVGGSRAPLRVTKDAILGTAERLGIPHPNYDPGLTLPIGSIDVSIYAMTRAWTGFLGTLVEPRLVVSASMPRLRTAYEVSSVSPKIVLDRDVSSQIVRGMRAVVEFDHGTAKSLANRYLPGIQAMGKTGTANGLFTTVVGGVKKTTVETTDNWFVGCTPSYCAGVWIGRKNKLPIPTTRTATGSPVQETGGRNALPVWAAIMKEAYRDRPFDAFPPETDPKKPFVRTPTAEK